MGIHLFQGCRRYKKDKDRISQDIRVLMGLVPPSPDKKKIDPDNITKWTAVSSALITLIGGIIKGFVARKTGTSTDSSQ